MNAPPRGLDDICALVEAAVQVLNDMGKEGECCSGIAKAALRIAVEPFLTEEDEDANIMELAEAERIESECITERH